MVKLQIFCKLASSFDTFGAIAYAQKHGTNGNHLQWIFNGFPAMKFLLKFVLCALLLLPLMGLAADESTVPMLKVTGNHLTTLSGDPIHLHGVDIPSLEWSQGDHLTNSLQVAISWGVNIVRLPLSQDRWFGRTREEQDGGAHYQKTVEDFVALAASRKCYVIVDLHWSDGDIWGQHIGQHNMPDDNSIAFWKDVSARFANHPAVLFDLYNEPHDISWDVWRNGGDVQDKDAKADTRGTPVYHTPGLQKLLEVCRATGARNVVVAGGIDWAYDLRGVASNYALNDHNGNGVIYDTHIYPAKTWYKHGTTKSQDWDRIIMSTGEKYPVIIGEFGNGTNDYEAQVLEFAKTNNLPWIAWCLHPHARPVLIKNWDYTPTKFGTEVKNALQAAVVKQ
jgi:endoglucanase